MVTIDERVANEIPPSGQVSVLPSSAHTEINNPLNIEKIYSLDQTLLVNPLNKGGIINLGPSNSDGPKKAALFGPAFIENSVEPSHG